MSAIDTVERARLRVAAGADVDPATLPGRARRALSVAREVGAPLGPALDAARAAMQADAEHRREVRVATAQGRAIATGLVGAPFVLVPVLTRAAGVDAARFYGSAPGLAVAAVAGTLWLVGGLLVIGLVRRAGRFVPARRRRLRGRALVKPLVVAGAVALVLHPMLGLLAGAAIARGPAAAADRVGIEEAAELMAVASAGGAGVGHMLRLAAAQLPDLERDLQRAALAIEINEDGSVPADLEPLVEIGRLAHELGAPMADALRTFAAARRADRRAAGLEAAARLPTQLTVPTALLLLPATLLLVGAPLVAGALASLPA